MGVLHLKEVECSNYRSYGDGEIFQFQEGFNIILGGNNSGKSNIIKGIGVIFEKLRNLTHIVSKEYLLDEEGQVKYELPHETPNISDEEYHNRNQGLPIRLRLTLSIGNKDLEYLGKIKYLLKSSQHGKKQPTEGLDRTFAGKVKEVDFIFEISTLSSREVDRRQKASMVLRFDEELNETKLSINNYFPDKFSIDKLTNLLKDRIIIFPEFRNKPEVRQNSDIVVDPSGLNLPLVLYNLKNRREPASQRKFDEIVKTFKDLFDMKLHVSEGHLLEFIKNDGTIIPAANSIKWTRSKEYKVLQELSTRPEIPKRADIEKFMLKLARKLHINIKILESDFEGIFKTDRFSSLLESLTYQYGQDKVLLGICIASEISRQNIPNDIREIINKLKSA